MRKLRALSALGLLLAPLAGFASIPDGMALPACASHYAAQYNVDIRLIQAIRIGEGGRVGQSVCGNANKTCDHGPMQINDGWFDGRWGVSLPRDFGITKESVLNNECQNIRVGMWVLMSAYLQTKDWFGAVEAYNAGITNRSAGYQYASRIFRWYEKLVAAEGKNASAPIAVSIPVQKTGKPKRRPVLVISEGASGAGGPNRVRFRKVVHISGA